MSFESFSQPAPAEVPKEKDAENPAEKSQEKSSGSTVGAWAKKTAALAGIAGIGYLGAMQESKADSTNELGPETSTNITQVLASTDTSSWSEELVPKTAPDGHKFLAEKYFKTDTLTGEVHVIGEYDNIIAASEALSKMPDVPESMKKLAEHDASAVKTERDFQASGLVAPKIQASGEVHTETKTFDGYGIHVENKKDHP